MPAITLPDGSVRRFDGPVTGTTVAAAIGPGLAKAALAIQLNASDAQSGSAEAQELRDLARPLPDGAHIAIVTSKDEQPSLALVQLR